MIGMPLTMKDGTIAVAAIIDLREFELVNKVKRPEMMKWFTQYQSVPAQWLSQQPESFLQHRVSA